MALRFDDIDGIARRLTPAFALATLCLATLCLTPFLAAGCASPGPPRSPSLNLPQPVSDLTASRTGNLVQLTFTVPHLSTDKLPLFDPHHRKPAMLHGTICREVKPDPCSTVATIAPQLSPADQAAFTWHETLPESLTTGAPRLLAYRIEFLNTQGKSAGNSNSAYTAAGPSPAPVADLRAQGTRSGILLQWTRDAGTADILLHRLDLAATPPATNTRAADLWLNANAREARTLDASINANTPYRYTALRRLQFTLDKHSVELRSDPSAPVDFTLQPVYPPATPTGIEATGFTPPDNSHFAVDLIWQPTSETGVTHDLAAPLAGYHVYREQLNPAATPTKIRLTATPTPQPSFHDPTADPNIRYRYSVTAIDDNGNESKPATFTLEPSPR